VATFPLEAPVSHIFEIAEGREVLMQFVGDPFWKRFSMEKKEWLPLPPANYSTSILAGNRSNIFVLDRSAAEVRRYQLPDLQLAATAKLNIGTEQIFAIRAGCNSDRAPVHVFCSGGPISLDAETLQRIEDSEARGPSPNESTVETWRVTGDGITVTSKDAFPNLLSFRGNAVGLRLGYFDSGSRIPNKMLMLCGAYDLQDNAISTCAKPGGQWTKITELAFQPGASEVFVFPNAPIVGRVVLGDTKSIPPKPPQFDLYNFFDGESFAGALVPELAGIMTEYGERRNSKHLLCVDPQSLRIGILTGDQKTWCVRDLKIKESFKRPLLMNWPDSSVTRGGDFRFEPKLLNQGSWTGEILGTRESTPVTVDGNGISFRVAANELAALFVLNLTLAGPEGKVSIPVPIHVQDPPLPFIWPDLNPGTDPDDFAAGFKTLSAPKEKRLALKTDFYASSDRILEMLGPINGMLALVTDAKRVDFVALDSHKVSGSISSSDKATFYAGGGALFEYDTNTRTLTRISVPDGRREARFTLPADVTIEAIAIGNERSQPLSLVLLRRDPNQASLQIGNLSTVTWHGNRAMVVLNSENLQGTGWTQPQVWTDGTQPNAAEEALNFFGFAANVPVRFVGSRNGAILRLRRHLALITPGFSVVAPYPEQMSLLDDVYSTTTERVDGSITGIVVSNSKGLASFNGLAKAEFRGGMGTPCGRYCLARLFATQGQERSFEIRSLETQQPLFRLNRLAALKADRAPTGKGEATSIQLLQDQGPAVIRSAGGKLLQFVDLDIPRLATQIAPDSFHVTSQPMPVVIQAGTYEYQVQVNNSNLVARYKLRDPAPNASISQGGLLRFTAPQNVHAPSRVPFKIEIEGRNGSTILHEFSVIVVSRKVPVPLMRKTQPRQAPLGGGVRTL
jgi:hypothetical protein